MLAYYTILLLACSQDKCQQFDLKVEMTKMQCETLAQLPISEWKNLHPKWTIKKWRCVLPSNDV